MKTYVKYLFFIAISVTIISCNQSRKEDKKPTESKEKSTEKVFAETNGIIIIEAENVALSKGWALEKEAKNYSGDGYLTWKDSTIIKKNNQGLLTYKFKVNKPGLYTVKIRNFHDCEDFTECNDIFVKMNDGTWEKNFNHTVNKWDWNTQQDINHVFSNSEFNLEKGSNTLYLSGRSQDFSIDKIAIFHKETQENAYQTASVSKWEDQ